MNAEIIQKYKDKTIKELLKTAERHFNEYIRFRDSENGWGFCISSGRPIKVPAVNSQAGHFYSAGKFPALRFNENNVHLQGKSDNYFNSGNLAEYRKNLVKKIGKKAVDDLDFIASATKRNTHKWDRFYLIEVIETYKQKKKTVK